MTDTDPVNVPPPPAPERPTVSIYQQPDHIAGLLQQLDGPLLQAERRSHGLDKEGTLQATDHHDAGLAVGATVPGIADIKAHVGGGSDAQEQTRHLATERRDMELVYSQALYLQRVRRLLSGRGLLRTVEGRREARGLVTGDFVEFEARFEPDQLVSLLDILTPELVQEIVRRWQMHRWAKVTDFGDHAEMMKAIERNKLTMETNLSLAAAITNAVRVDFRSEETREFHGVIQTGDRRPVTAITICDTAHFTVTDVDRILDGRFTVLGKVTEGVQKDRPIFERNKLLDKVNPVAVDGVVDSMNDALTKGQQTVEGKVTSFRSDQAFDFRLRSRVSGPSFKVIPIAIFT